MADATDNATRYALLALIYGRPMSGYEIKKSFDEGVAYFWNASYGQIYPELKKLLAGGFASVREERNPGRPAKKIYRITEKGRKALSDWLAKPPHVRPTRSEVALKLCFGALGRIEDQIAHLSGFRAEQEQKLKALRAFKAQTESEDSPRAVYSLLTLKMGIAIAEAMTRWARESELVLSAMRSNAPKRNVSKSRAFSRRVAAR